jgi:hypothetical protein
MPGKFRTTSYLRLKKFVGEATAYAAGAYTAICELDNLSRNCTDPDPWQTYAERHSINVRGLQSDELLTSSIRLAIVSIYSGLDSYIESTKEQLKILRATAWTQNDGDSLIDALKRNFPLDERKTGIDTHGQLSCLDYYRLLRNSIVHQGNDGFDKAMDYFNSESDALCRFREKYRFDTAPCAPNALTYHDVKAIARALLGTAEAVETQLDPGNEKLRSLIPRHHMTLPSNKPTRQKNAAMGWLRDNYGITGRRALDILNLTG